MQQKSIDNSLKERYITVTKYEKQISRRKKDGNEKIEKSGDDSGSQYVVSSSLHFSIFSEQKNISPVFVP